MGNRLEILNSSEMLISVSCPLCGKKDQILLSKDELKNAKENLELITKAFQKMVFQESCIKRKRHA